jgi:EAL domain-containing protein (putative c-di-GMP-specific phosphodiesterase class I)/GGDEF domain-containing protein/CheY-like chemotaxis protein
MIRILLCAERRSDVAITAGFLRQVSAAYEVEWAHSFADAVARSMTDEHQLLLVDASLGMGRGLELLHQHIEGGSRTPVILLVPPRDPTIEAVALRAGAADVLVRDEIDPRSLERAVRHAIARARMGHPYGWRPGATLVHDLDVACDRVELAIQRARRTKLGSAVLAVSYDMPASARRTAERVGAAFFATLHERIKLCLGLDDDVLRIGDHEFLAVAGGLPGTRAAAECGGKILSALSEPIDVASQQVRLAGQVGVASFPDHGSTAQILVTHAREAMHSARAGERSQLRMHQAPRSRPDRRGDVRRLVGGAIDRAEVLMHYQPQIHTDDGSLVGVEALMRWTSPELGSVSPAEFIPIIEELGLIEVFGEWALHESCRQGKRWLDAGAPIRVGVNVSAQQFARNDLGATVRGALQASGLPPELLELEITEGLLLENTTDTRRVLQSLRGEGVLVAVDDFGTGYASLSYVKRFPMDVIKIDREFVRNLPLDTENVAITSSIVALAQSLGLGVIAEGVENEAEEEFLRDLRCPVVQGYLHARPMTAEALDEWRAARPESSPRPTSYSDRALP